MYCCRTGSPKGLRTKKNISNADLVEEKSLPGTGQSKKVSSHHSLTDSHTTHRPPAGLTATTTSEIILVISPVLRPQYIGIIMASCQRKGFRIRGVKRQRLTSKKVACLGKSCREFDTEGAYCKRGYLRVGEIYNNYVFTQ